ncbi:peptidoglycan-binding domain-containing protein [Streptomyces indicus]|uniref:Putative peptidoglycan binding domain-containing protein n=1 Tax=Streptomyces indicus TaxID=417292 RepID=A0A1G9EGD3_9ACTN|nr:peptidoglycan-binding protein [Streptomyces indicus]SDK75148.1 Putative peptidoglycan binding domain-containing protein [Streptomyces indicus]
MHLSKQRRFGIAAASVAAGAGLLFTGVAPAVASPGSPGGQYVIDGKGDPTNDWHDEGNLSKHSYAHSNATRLWQTILWADGAKYKGSDGKWHWFTKDQIDGHFGPRTHSATKYWQKREGLAVDGVVGKQTFGYADDYLSPVGNGKMEYSGYERNVVFKRSGGLYHVKVDGHWKKASYNWRS